MVGAISIGSFDTEEARFYKQSYVVWNASMGDPNTFNDTNKDQSLQRDSERTSYRVSGRTKFRFSIAIPRKSTIRKEARRHFSVALSSSTNTTELYELPPSFNGRPSTIAISYSLMVKVGRGASGLLSRTVYSEWVACSLCWT
jgi:hypothetical protein